VSDDAAVIQKAQEFARRGAPDLVPGELLRIRARIYRVSGFNAYGQAMVEEVRWPLDGERERSTEVSGVR